jgi:Recombinase
MSARRKRRRERQRRRHHEAKPQVSWAPPSELHKVRDVDRLAYSRKQAAEALGVSVSTIDRRLVPAVSTVKTPWGQRLIPVAELERFVREHLEPARARAEQRPAGRPPTLPPSVVDRIKLEYARGWSLGEIAKTLNAEGVPTAHGGRRWWPSTVRAILVRGASGPEPPSADSASSEWSATSAASAH